MLEDKDTTMQRIDEILAALAGDEPDAPRLPDSARAEMARLVRAASGLPIRSDLAAQLSRLWHGDGR